MVGRGQASQSEAGEANPGTPSLRADDAIGSLAAGQHGVVNRAQLLRAGVSPDVVNRRLHTRLLRRVHAGVYRVGPVIAPRAREMAAVLACDGAVVSHRTAAALWMFLPPQHAGEPVDVTLPRNRHRGRRPGIRAHQSDIADHEITRIDGVPVTSPARTIFDLATLATARELERALAAAERASSDTRDQVASLLHRNAGRRGTRRLRALLRMSTPALTRSEAEERLLALIRKAGLPEPATNVVVHGHEVDCYWRRARLVVEVDGYAYHASARAFLKDRRRDSALAAAGIQVARLSWQQIHDDPEKTLVQLAMALARARP